MNLLQHLPVLIVVVPLIAVPVIPLAGSVNKNAGWFITLCVTAFSFLASLSVLQTVWSSGAVSYNLGGWAPPWGIEFRFDLLNAFVMIVITFIAFISVIYGKTSVEKEISADKINPFYAVYVLFVVGLFGIVATGDVFNLYVFLEITSLAGYALIAAGSRRYAKVASFNYLILGTITDYIYSSGYRLSLYGNRNSEHAGHSRTSACGLRIEGGVYRPCFYNSGTAYQNGSVPASFMAS